MNISISGRVSEVQKTLGSARQIARTQADIADAASQVSTGKRVLSPSDAPGDAAAALQVRRNLELSEGHDRSLAHASRMLSRADGALEDTTQLLREARQIGLANVGDEAGDAERAGAATVLRTIERQLLAVANTAEGGVALFGGRAGVTDPFVAYGGGVRYNGGDGTVGARVDDSGRTLDLLVPAHAVFGGNSRRVAAASPGVTLTPDTRLGDLGGARGNGIDRGGIRLTAGGASAVVDLTDADTVGDVLDRINAAGLPVTATLNAAGDGIDLAGAGVTVGDIGQATAADLGLLQNTPVPAVAGAGLAPRLTPHTPLATLNGGTGVPTGVFTIANGSRSATVDTAGLVIVGDLLNAVNAAGVDVSAAVTDDGRLTLRNTVQGSGLRVNDVAGGSTAAALGWRTFTEDDLLSDLNGGRGVRRNPDGPDLRLRDTAGVLVEVNLDAATTIRQALDAINAAAAAAGAIVTATFDGDTPGIVINNVTEAGSIDASAALVDLGLDAGVAGTTLVGRDVNAVEVDGPFTHLRSLIAAFETGDAHAAGRALARLETSEQQAITARGEVGGTLREADQRRERLADARVAQAELLSRFEDVDVTEAIIRFQALQTSLQAQLQATSRLLGGSLFDYLR